MTAINYLSDIARADSRLERRYADRLIVNHALDRRLVSFQANKAEGGYRWCKYKEGFSASLMRFLFDKIPFKPGKILDPFAGSGTALFIASDLGREAVGIELLPSSAEVISVRQLLRKADGQRIAPKLRKFAANGSWERAGKESEFSHIKITHGAFPPETQRQLNRYLYDSARVPDHEVARVLRFAALCILESISYTRKDGQYLRWDARSGRKAGNFNKGPILEFTSAIKAKLLEIADDITGERMLFQMAATEPAGPIELLAGSCLEHLPQLANNSAAGIITSPPYCNRYDYTRTYALELAMLGIDEDRIRSLRQAMLTCTVENREKERLAEIVPAGTLASATSACASQQSLQMILAYLEECRTDGTINNTGIPRMVRNYFREMAIVIFECARVLKPGAPFVMVNDNVRYQGAHVPVDLILADFAERAGLDVETIWVLPRGKGNSSQQMGAHGREEVRKCVYVWRKRAAIKAKPATLRDRRLVPAR